MRDAFPIYIYPITKRLRALSSNATQDKYLAMC